MSKKDIEFLKEQIKELTHEVIELRGKVQILEIELNHEKTFRSLDDINQSLHTISMSNKIMDMLAKQINRDLEKLKGEDKDE